MTFTCCRSQIALERVNTHPLVIKIGHVEAGTDATVKHLYRSFPRHFRLFRSVPAH